MWNGTPNTEVNNQITDKESKHEKGDDHVDILDGNEVDKRVDVEQIDAVTALDGSNDMAKDDMLRDTSALAELVIQNGMSEENSNACKESSARLLHNGSNVASAIDHSFLGPSRLDNYIGLGPVDLCNPLPHTAPIIQSAGDLGHLQHKHNEVMNVNNLAPSSLTPLHPKRKAVKSQAAKFNCKCHSISLMHYNISVLVVLALLILIPKHSGHAHRRPSDDNHVALFIFGDSIFDVGNNNNINTTATTFFQANFWPYGETTFNYPTGRCCDGRLIPDFIAEYAKLPLIPPYMQLSNNHQFTNGVNFASGGAGALVETFKGLVIDLKTQVANFKKVEKSLMKQLGDKEAKKILSRAIYLISIGSVCITPYHNAIVLHMATDRCQLNRGPRGGFEWGSVSLL
ncbi:hypothetical protein TEA_013277 [Camellia sinensis var. sinensis]|uniref:Uncharacterized protein n=1 Tax=Camellia sinensis var. sinensis TaxID=542762 RepID=A0A4S4D5T1_CAMSN|nr:hypothetical protein TEA_013277 [Camellia sinensis var. sinensis]